MEIVYWGTGAAEGIPAVFCSCPTCQAARAFGGKDIRTRAQMLIDSKLLIDMGPDTFAHSLQYKVSLMDIRHVFITHSHSDHFYGEDLVFRAEPYGHDTLGLPLNLYGNEKVKLLLEKKKAVYNDTDCFDNCVQYHCLKDFQTVTAAEYEITPLPTVHDQAEVCFIFSIHSLADDKWLLYGNDSSIFPEETLRWLSGRHFDLVSLDCTCGNIPDVSSHMSLPMCQKLVACLRAQGTIGQESQVIITHFSHNGGLLHAQLCELSTPDGFIVAYDGMRIKL